LLVTFGQQFPWKPHEPTSSGRLCSDQTDVRCKRVICWNSMSRDMTASMRSALLYSTSITTRFQAAMWKSNKHPVCSRFWLLLPISFWPKSRRVTSCTHDDYFDQSLWCCLCMSSVQQPFFPWTLHVDVFTRAAKS
jgi:hypothetical protein